MLGHAEELARPTVAATDKELADKLAALEIDARSAIMRSNGGIRDDYTVYTCHICGTTNR